MKFYNNTNLSIRPARNLTRLQGFYILSNSLYWAHNLLLRNQLQVADFASILFVSLPF